MNLFKKALVLLVAALILMGCASTANNGGNNNGNNAGNDTVAIEDLKVVFVPSRDAKDIAEQTEPLKQLLIDELALAGYEVAKVSIDTMTSYEAAGEAVASGSAHIGLLPGGTYVAYADRGVDVILASTRNGLKYDSTNPQDWNTGEANENNTDIVTYYRGILVAGPSAKGQELAEKVAAGTKLTWEDVSTAKWCVQSPTSGSGYQYPAVWLNDNFGKTYVDMPAENVVEGGGYGGAAAKLALEQCDVAPGYNDFRMDNAEAWTAEYGLIDIWTETAVIGVTEKIQNDTVSVSTAVVDADLAAAIADAFINLSQTEAGAQAIKIYNHNGYSKVTAQDYEGARKVNELVSELNQ